MLKKDNLTLLFIFLLSMFLIKLPVFYITPLQSKVLTTHTFSKFILLTIFIYFLGRQIFNKINIFNPNNSNIMVVFLFFLSQALSGLVAIDIYFYLKDLHNLFFAFLIFIIAYFIIRINKKNLLIITKFMILTGVLMVLLDFVYFLSGQAFLNIIKPFLEKESFPVYQVNLDRGRYNLYLYTEIFFSFFFFFYITENRGKRIFLLIIICLLFFLCYISNFRHRLFFLFIEFVFAAFFIINRIRKPFYLKSLSLIMLLFCLVFLTSTFLTHPYYKQNLIDRLLMSDVGDLSSAYFRVENFKTAIDLFVSSPLLGVGLGNYKVFSKRRSNFFTIDKISNELYLQTISDPHSVFSKTLSESGVLGIIAFISMIFFFIKRDLLFIKKYIKTEKHFWLYPYMFSFWAYFIIILITPSITLFRGGWFWFLRGIIEGCYNNLKLS